MVVELTWNIDGWFISSSLTDVASQGAMEERCELLVDILIVITAAHSHEPWVSTPYGLIRIEQGSRC